MLGSATNIGIEPSLRAEISDQLGDLSLHPAPLVEQLRVIKSPAELEAIRRAAKCVLWASRVCWPHPTTDRTWRKDSSRLRTVMKQIIRDSDQFNPLLSKVLMGTWS